MTGRAKVLLGLILMVVAGFGYHHYGDELMKLTDKIPSTRTRVMARKIADVNAEVREINERIYAIKSKDEIIEVIDLIETKAGEFGDNLTLKLYRAVTRPLRELEAISWRFGDVLEDSKALHMSLLQAIREVYYNKYQVGSHVIALVQYLTVPAPGKYKRFKTIEDVQDFLEGKYKGLVAEPDKEIGLWDQVEASIADIQTVLDQADDNWQFELDGKLAFGNQEGLNLISENRRYVHVLKGNVKLMLAGYLKAQALVKAGVNYNFNQGPNIIKKMLKNTAINSVFGGIPKAITPQSFSIGLTQKGSNFFKLRESKKDVAAANLESAFRKVCQAIKIEQEGHTESIVEIEFKDGINYLVNPIYLRAGREDMENRFGELNKLFKAGQDGDDCSKYEVAKASVATISSVYTGEQIDINIGVLFKPYEDVKTQFLAVGKQFYNTNDKAGEELGRGRGKWWKWNYMYGMPVSWPDTTFGGLIPDDSDNNKNRSFLQNIAVLKRTNALGELAAYLPVP